MGLQILYRRKIGAIFDLEVFGAGEARRMRGGFVIAANGLADPPGKPLELFLASSRPETAAQA